MPQSFIDIIIHFVFSTKNRSRSIDPSIQPRLYENIGGIIKYTLLIFLTALILISPGKAPALNLLGTGNNPVYRSSALVEVNIGKQKNEIDRANSWSEIKSLIFRLESRTQIEDIVNELNLARSTKTKKEYRDLVDRVQKGVKIEIDKKGSNLGFIRVVCKYSEPEACRKIVNLLIRQMITRYLEEQDHKLEHAIDWLSEEIARYRNKLKEATELLEDFQKENPTLRSESPEAKVAASAAGPIPGEPLLARYIKYSGEALDLEIELKIMRKSEERLREKVKNSPEYIISRKIINPQSQELISQTTEINPIHQKITEALFDLEMTIAETAERHRLVREIAESTLADLKDIPGKKRKLAQLGEKYEIYSRIYRSLIERREAYYIDRRIELEERGTRFQIIDNAQLPLEPVK